MNTSTKKVDARQRAFTLIELLVVIAIIGILASIVLISLNTARQKAADVKVISDVKQIRTTLEADLGGSASYPDLTNTGPIYGGLDPNAVGSSSLNSMLADANNQRSAINVVNTPSSGLVVGYAIYGQLVSSSTLYFCMDSNGNTNQQANSNTNPTCP